MRTGKQRMRDDKVTTSNTASTKNNPMSTAIFYCIARALIYLK